MILSEFNLLNQSSPDGITPDSFRALILESFRPLSDLIFNHAESIAIVAEKTETAQLESTV